MTARTLCVGKGRSRPGASRGGFSLLEVALYITLALLLGMPLVSIVLASSRTTTENDTFNKVTERNRTALLRMEGELRESLLASVIVGDAGRSVQFSPPGGFDGTRALAAPVASFALRYSPGEYYNGRDDNGNGLVDDGELVRTETSTGQQQVIAAGIDVNGSGFAQGTAGLTMTLRSLGTMGAEDTFGVSKSMTVFPRN